MLYLKIKLKKKNTKGGIIYENECKHENEQYY